MAGQVYFLVIKGIMYSVGLFFLNLNKGVAHNKEHLDDFLFIRACTFVYDFESIELINLILELICEVPQLLLTFL